MSIASIRTGRFSGPVVVLMLWSFLATFLPARTSRASDDDSVAPVPIGTGGPSSLGGPLPSSNSPDGLATVDLSTGAAKSEYTFTLPPARGDAQPSLGLRYSSANGTGFAGEGWTLNVPSITRRGRAGIPRFQDDVVTHTSSLTEDLGTDDYLIDGQLLIPIATSDGNSGSLQSGENWPAFTQNGTWIYFRREIDDGVRYFFLTNGFQWVAQTKSGHTLTFGIPCFTGCAMSSGSIEYADATTTNALSGGPPAALPGVYRWNLVRDADASGNTVYYVWDDQHSLFSATTTTAGTQYLTDIYDTLAPGATADPTQFEHHVHLTWGLAQYPGGLPAGGAPATIPYANSPIWAAVPFAQLQTVDVTSAPWASTGPRKLVREYQLLYTLNDTQTRQYLTTITMIGTCSRPAGPGIPVDRTPVEDPTTGRISPASVQGCPALPSTTYSYYGVTGASPGPVPQILKKSNAFQVQGGMQTWPTIDGTAYGAASGLPPLLLDVNGDARADLTHFQLLDKYGASYGSDLIGATFGATVQFGGMQGAAAVWTFVQTLSVGLPGNTGFADQGTRIYDCTSFGNLFLQDLVFGDWGSTGRLSALSVGGNPSGITNLKCSDVGPDDPTANNPPTDPLYYTVNAWQFADPVVEPFFHYTATVVFQPSVPVPAADLTRIQNDNPFGTYVPRRAVDVDGDGLPDMTLLPDEVSPGVFHPYFSTRFSSRDRAGVTHPFLTTSPQYCIAPSYDPTQFGGAGSNATRAMADVDGDGLPDLIIANKFGTGMSQAVPLNYVGFNVLTNRGDGRYGIPDGSTNCYASYGASIFPTAPGQSDQSDSVGADPMQNSVIRFGDLNGDGMADYAVLDSSGLSVCLRHGPGLDSARWMCAHDSTLNYGAVVSWTTNGQTWTGTEYGDIEIGDLDGSGINQVVYFPPASSLYGGTLTATAVLVAPNGTAINGVVQPRNGLLQTVSNGFGASTRLVYQTVASMGIGSLPVPAWAVTQATTTNGLSGNQALTVTSRYRYSGPIYDPRDRAYVGFRSVIETRLGGTNAPGTVTTTTFATQACGPTTTTSPVPGSVATSCASGVDYSFYHATRGLPALVEVTEQSAAATKFVSVVNKYELQNPYPNALDGRSVALLSLYQRQRYLWDDTQAAAPPITLSPISDALANDDPRAVIPNVSLPKSGAEIVRETDVNLLGNVVGTTDFGVVGKDNPIGRTVTWNLPPSDTTGWSYRPTQIVTTNSGWSQELHYGYDPQGRLTSTAAMIGGELPLAGPDGTANSWAAGIPPYAAQNSQSATPTTLTTIGYDPVYGNVTSIGTADNACAAQMTYDPTFQQFPSDTYISPQGCGGNGVLHTSMTFDPGFGVVTSRYSPIGELTSWGYDEYGRLAEVSPPDPKNIGMQSTAAIITHHDASPVSMVETDVSDGDEGAGTLAIVKHYRFYDGLGEERAAIDPTGNSTTGLQWVYSGLHQNYPNGRLAIAYQPFVTSQDPSTVAPGSLPNGPPAPIPSQPTHVFGYNYDGLGRMVKFTDLTGHASTAKYHTAALSVDLRDAEQVAGAHTAAWTTITRDGHGRIAQVDQHLSNTGPQGSAGVLTTALQYLGPPIKPTAIQQSFPGGSVTRTMQYDTLTRLVQNSEPNSGPWTYAYNTQGQLVGVADARGCGQDIYRDLIGRLIARDFSTCLASQTYTPAQADTGTGTEAYYLYDDEGRVTDVYDQAQHTNYSYDNRDRVIGLQTSLATPAGDPVLANRYAAHSFTKSITDYSPTNRPITMTTGADIGELTQNGSSVTTSYGYDGRVASITSSYGTLLQNQTFDATGALSQQVFGDLANTTADFVVDDTRTLRSYHLHRAGGPWDTSGGYSSPSTNDLTVQGELTNLQVTPDLVGNPTAVTDSVPAAGWPRGSKPTATLSYTYGDDYRLRTLTADTGGDTLVTPYVASDGPATSVPRIQSQSFAYDWRGNTTSSTDDAALFYDRSLGTVTIGGPGYQPDQLAQASLGSQSLSTLYDTAGNLTQITLQPSGTQYRYTWDEVGRLATAARMENGGAVEQEVFAYDANGARVRKSRHNFTTGQDEHTLNVFDSLVLAKASFDTDYADTSLTENVYLAGGLAHVFYATATNSTALPNPGSPSNWPVHVDMLLGDPRGSTAFVIDHDTSELVERITYQAYGPVETDYRPNRWGNFQEDVKFTGHWDDAEVGLSYSGARYYAPQLGRFISPDPMTVHGFAADPNPYAYVGGSPISHVDPFGLGPDGCDDLSPGCSSGTGGGGGGGSVGLGGDSGFGDWIATGVSDAWDATFGKLFGGGSGGGSESHHTYGTAHETAHAASPDPGQRTAAAGLPTAGATAAGGFYVNWWRLIDPSGVSYAVANNVSVAMDPNVSTDLRVANGVIAIGAVLPLTDLEVGALEGVEISAAEALAPSSRTLGAALEEAGFARGAGEAAHHIVAGSAEAAAPARQVLARFGIGINDAANGIFLPGNLAAENAAGAAVHSTLHTAEYYRAVNAALAGATSREGALLILNDIGESLSGGGFP
jgi:RHS repeat-associated protein